MTTSTPAAPEPQTPRAGDRVRLTPGGVVHIVWGSQTVCNRRLRDYPKLKLINSERRADCRRCTETPVATLTYASGRIERYVAR